MHNLGNVTLYNLRWDQYIESSLEERKDDLIKIPLTVHWGVTAHIQMPDSPNTKQIEFTGGQNPEEIILSLQILSAKKSTDLVKRYNLQNSSGALICNEEAGTSDFLIHGIIVLDDEAFESITSTVKFSSPISSELHLSLEGLQISDSIDFKYVWDNKNTKRIKVTHVQVVFRYGYQN